MKAPPLTAQLTTGSAIELLIPDMPSADDVLPWLRRIDAARKYTNFGPLVVELERLLVAHWPTDWQGLADALAPINVVTLSSGTASLELGIAALGLPAGAEVLLPALSFPATAAAVVRHGAKPVFADVAADSWQLTPGTARAVAAQRPLALVMPVATFGCPLDAVAWDSFVDDTGVPVLMDAAAAFGNQPIGRSVHVAISLHATKPFGVGEGGLLVTRSAEMAQAVRRLSNFGFDGGLVTAASGNAKMSEYAAAVALAQWSRWGQTQSARRALWAAYRDRLAALPGLVLQAGYGGEALPATLVVQLTADALKVAGALARVEIHTRRWYQPSLQWHPAFAAFQVFTPDSSGVMPVTGKLASHAVGLPWHNFLQTEELDRIAAALRHVAA